MDEMIDICNTPIKLSEIKEYRINYANYIFRPVFIEKKKTLFGSDEKYAFSRYEPFGAIMDSKGHASFISSAMAVSVGENVFKELSLGIVDKLADVFKLNAIKERQLSILTVSNGKITIRLSEIPCKITTLEGQTIEVQRHDAIAKELGYRFQPNSNIVECLTILLKNGKYEYFFGSNIHADNVHPLYERLKSANNAVLSNTELKKKPVPIKQSEPQKSLQPAKIAIPKIELPKIKLPEIDVGRIKLSFIPKGKDDK